MSYEGNMKLAESSKNNPENNATTLPTIITQFPKKDSYKYGTNQSK
jgi:hypothetical protein